MSKQGFSMELKVVVLGMLMFLPLIGAQDTRAQNKQCVFQDGSNRYQWQASEHCPNLGEMRKNLTDLDKYVKSQVDAVEKKIAEMHSNTLRQIAQDIDILKTNQRVLEQAIVRQLGSASGLSSTCKGNYIQNGTSCYNFVEHASDWFESQTFCMAQGAHLVAIETREEDAFLRDYLNSFNRYRAFNFWTGGNDIEVEGQFVWVGTGEIFPISLWAPGEPGNTGVDHEGKSGTEQCMLINAHYGWNDGVCRTKTYYICEYHLRS